MAVLAAIAAVFLLARHFSVISLKKKHTPKPARPTSIVRRGSLPRGDPGRVGLLRRAGRGAVVGERLERHPPRPRPHRRDQQVAHLTPDG